MIAFIKKIFKVKPKMDNDYVYIKGKYYAVITVGNKKAILTPIEHTNDVERYITRHKEYSIQPVYTKVKTTLKEGK